MADKTPAQVLALAAAVNGVPLDWKVTPEKTVIVMVDGRKLTFSQVGIAPALATSASRDAEASSVTSREQATSLHRPLREPEFPKKKKGKKANAE